MQTCLFLVVVTTICGLSFTPKFLLKSGPAISGIGLALLISFGSLISMFVRLSVGLALSIVIVLSTTSLGYRLIKDFNFRISVVNFCKTYLPLFAIGNFLTSFLISKLNFDFAVRNFDAYYAVQDGIFLSDHPAYAHIAGAQEVLPLNWSASTNDRYGISFLIGVLRYLHVGNPWGNAQYVMVFTLILLVALSSSLIKRFFSLTNAQSFTVFLIIGISPAILIPLEYFMFGQVLGLVVIFCSLITLTYREVNRFALIIALGLGSTTIVIYPAMFFPASLFCVMYILFDNEISILKRFRKALIVGLAALALIIVQFGFHFGILAQRIWAWIGGTLFSHQVKLDSFQFVAKVFGQFSSKIGLPLFLGILRYPFIPTLNNISMIFLNLLSLFGLFIFFAFIFAYPKGYQTRILKAFVFSWLLMAFVALVKGNSYVLAKFSTWTMPIILGVFSYILLKNLHSGSWRSLTVKQVGSTLLAFIIVMMSLASGINYAKNLKSWNSFSQVPTPVQYSSLHHVSLPGESKVAVDSPTAEESIWTAAQYSSIAPNRFRSLAATSQALGSGLSSDCKLNSIQQNFEQLGFVIVSRRIVDVTPPLVFSGSPISRSTDFSIFRADNLVSGFVLNSGGLFPPSRMSNFEGKRLDTGAIRWSSGEVCVAEYLNIAKTRSFSMSFYSGPDLSNPVDWQIAVNGISSRARYSEGELKFKIDLHPGWNLIQVKEPSCYSSRVQYQSRWNARADDRNLCFAVTQIGS
jgi:hypothetical protein